MKRPGPGRWEAALWIGASLLVLAAIAWDPVPRLRGPAPYPPEWQWEYRVEPPAGSAIAALAAAAGLLGLLAVTGTAAARRRPRQALAAILGGATLLGWLLQLGLLELEPGGAFQRLLSQTLYRTATSYFTVAASDQARDPIAFLRMHHELLAGFRKSAKHAATHPPGPVLYYRALIAVTEASPALTGGVLETTGLARGDPVRPRPYPESARAAALLGALLIGLLCAATCWPVAWLAHSAGCAPLEAARVGVLWTLLPGPVLMHPQFDQALALPVATATACLAAAVGSRGREAGGLSILAGLAGGLALFFSYGSPVFLAVGGIVALALAGGRPGGAARAVRVGMMAFAVAALVFFLPLAVGHQPLASARAALSIHREFYTRPRSYSLWLLYNPLDLALFLGVPVALAWLVRTARSAAAVARGDAFSVGRAGDRLRVASAAGLLVLIVAGVTRGEVGRIWIPIMPVLLVAAWAPSSDPEGGPGEPRSGITRWEALLCGALLAAFCLALRLFWRVP